MLDSIGWPQNQRLTYPPIFSSYQRLLKHVSGMDGYSSIEQFGLVAQIRQKILCREYSLSLLVRIAPQGRSRQIFAMNPIFCGTALSQNRSAEGESNKSLLPVKLDPLIEELRVTQTAHPFCLA